MNRNNPYLKWNMNEHLVIIIFYSHNILLALLFTGYIPPLLLRSFIHMLRLKIFPTTKTTSDSFSII